MKLSIIIPAYNASSTIIRTLDSIYNLPLNTEDFEVVVVDDCSTDDTLELLQNYASHCTNLCVLHQAYNKRQGAARNRGLAEALGEYIMYVDADDVVEIGLVESVNYALKSDLDMLFCTTAWENEEHEFVPRKYDIPNHVVMSGYEFAEKYYDVVCVGPWTYIWKREFLESVSIPFIENRRMEDFDFVERHIVKADRIAYSAPVIYKYFINEGSTVRTINYETVADWVHVCYRRWKFCETLPLELSTFIKKIDFQCRCFVSSSLSLRRLTRFSGKDVRKLLNRIGQAELHYIYKKGGWSLFPRLCMKTPSIVIALVSITNPMADFSRRIVRTMRK